MQILFVGDVMLGRLVNRILRNEDAAYPWGDTLDLFARADIRCCNLECVISDWGEPWSVAPKVFHFRSDAKNVAVLRAAGMDVVSLANNHVLDYGYEAMDDCLRLLDRDGICHAGAGRDLAVASAPVIVAAQGMKIAFLACTDNEPQWAATPDRPGISYVPIVPDSEPGRNFLARVADAKAHNDLVVASAHWGPNWGEVPPAEHALFAKSLIEAGGDIVFGHSPHILRGIELHAGKPIIYAAGDFVDDYAVDEVERNDHSAIFVVETAGAGVTRLRLYPTVIRRMQARRAQQSDADQIAERVRRLCADLGTESRWQPAGQYLEIAVADAA